MKDSITPSDKDATNAVKNINDVFPREQPETIATNSTVTPSKEDSERTCPDCDGYGELSPDRTCPRCEGSGTIDATPSKEGKHTPDTTASESELSKQALRRKLDFTKPSLFAEGWRACFDFTAQEVEDLRKEKARAQAEQLESRKKRKEEIRELRERNRVLEEAIEEIRADAKLSSEYYMDGFVNLDDRANGYRDGYKAACLDLIPKLRAVLSSNESKTPNEEP